MNKTLYDRIGETVWRGTLPNGLPILCGAQGAPRQEICLLCHPLRRHGHPLLLGRQVAGHSRGHCPLLWRHKMFDTKEGNALQELAKNGAEPNAFTSNAITAYYFDSTEHFEENLRILLSFVSIPYFTKESVAKEQGIIGQEIRMIEDNPEWQVYTRMMQALYKTSTARTSVAGTVESISHITAETLYDCHKAFYTPSNMMLCVVGNVEPQRIMDIAYEVLPQGKPEPAVPRDYGTEDAGVAAARTEREMEVAMPMFLGGFKCTPPQEGESSLRTQLVGDLACDLLLGPSSPLYRRLYEQQLYQRLLRRCL